MCNQLCLFVWCCVEYMNGMRVFLFLFFLLVLFCLWKQLGVFVFLGRTLRFGSEHIEQNSVCYGHNSFADHDDHQGLSLVLLSFYNDFIASGRCMCERTLNIVIVCLSVCLIISLKQFSGEYVTLLIFFHIVVLISHKFYSETAVISFSSRI